MSRKIKKSDHSKTNRYQMVIDNYVRKDFEMTGDLGSKILFGRMNIYSFSMYSYRAPSDYIFIFSAVVYSFSKVKILYQNYANFGLQKVNLQGSYA